MKKNGLRDAILHQLRSDLATQTRAAQLARDEAISEESRPENKWDTHSQEAAYLAEGQARVAADIAKSIEIYTTLPLPDFRDEDPIALGAVIGLEGGGATANRTWYFLGPRAGGMEVSVEGNAVLVITPQSPLGQQVLGRRTGETVIAPGRGKSVEARIVSVA